MPIAEKSLCFASQTGIEPGPPTASLQIGPRPEYRAKDVPVPLDRQMASGATRPRAPLVPSTGPRARQMRGTSTKKKETFSSPQEGFNTIQSLADGRRIHDGGTGGSR